MSADNGYIIRVHPNGGFACRMYFASEDEERFDEVLNSSVLEEEIQYLTLDDAIRHCEGTDVPKDDPYYGYGAEYGYQLGDDVRALLAKEQAEATKARVAKATCPHCHEELVVEVIVK